MKVCVIYSDGDLQAAYPEDHQGRNVVQNLEDVSEALRSLGHDVISLNAGQGLLGELERLKGDVDVLFSLADEGFDLDTSLEPNVVAAFDLVGIPYTGAGFFSLALCLDKPLAKRLLCAQGLPTPRFKVFDSVPTIDGFSLRFPVIVKPAREDGSIGIRQDSVVDSREALLKKIDETVRQYEQPVLVEEYVDGREVNVAVLGNEDLVVLPPSEIIFSLPEGVRNFLFYETKWHEDSVAYNATTPQCPADLEDELKDELISLAKDAFRALGLRGYGRVDFRIDPKGRPFILEVNPNPDLCKDAGLARMAKAHGWSYEELIGRLLELALEQG